MTEGSSKVLPENIYQQFHTVHFAIHDLCHQPFIVLLHCVFCNALSYNSPKKLFYALPAGKIQFQNSDERSNILEKIIINHT